MGSYQERRCVLIRLDNWSFTEFMRKKLSGLIAFIILFSFPILWEGMDHDRYRGLLVLILFIGGWLIFRAVHDVPINIPKVILPLSLYICFQAILLIIAPIPYTSYYIVITNLGILLVFLFFVDTLNVGWKPRTWENALISIAVFLSIIEYSGIFLRFYNWWKITGTIFSFPMLGFRLNGVVFGHPNPTAGFYNLIIPILFVRFLTERSKLYRGIWGLLLLAFSFIVFLTASRGGWVALIAGIIVTAILVYGKRILSERKFVKFRYKSLKKTTLSRWLLILGIIFAVIAITVLGITQINLTPHGGRSEVWRNAINLFMASPLIGNGPNSFQILDTLQSHSITREYFFPHAHNFWLQIAAETGIVGLALMVWAALLIVRAYITAWQKSGSNSGRLALAAYTGIFVVIVVSHLVDYFIYRPLYSISVVLILSLTLSYAPSTEQYPLSKKRGGLVFLILLALCIFGNGISLTNTVKFSNGVQAARDGDWMLARDNICQAFDENPHNTFWGFQCSLANAYVAYLTDDILALNDAIKYQESNLEKDSFWYVHWANLASYEWEIGNFDSAITHMRQAVSIAPRNSFLLLNLGWMEEKLDHQDRAESAYRHARCLNPWLKDSIFYTETLTRKRALENECMNETFVHDTYIEKLLGGWESYYDHDYDSAANNFNKAAQLTPKNSIALASQGYLLEESGDSKEAWARIQQALILDSASYRTLHISAKVAQIQGKTNEARELIKRSLFLIQNTNLSKRYYFSAYHYDFLPTDISPFLIRPGINNEFMENYYWLEEDYLNNNQLDEYNKLKILIERNLLPQIDGN